MVDGGGGGLKTDGLGGGAGDDGPGLEDGTRSSDVACGEEVIVTDGTFGADADGVAIGVVTLVLLLAFNAANELVVNARNCAEDSIGAGNSSIVAVFDGGVCEKDWDCDLTVPRALRIESSKSCLVACFSSARASSGTSIRS